MPPNYFVLTGMPSGRRVSVSKRYTWIKPSIPTSKLNPPDIYHIDLPLHLLAPPSPLSLSEIS